MKNTGMGRKKANRLPCTARMKSVCCIRVVQNMTQRIDHLIEDVYQAEFYKKETQLRMYREGINSSFYLQRPGFYPMDAEISEYRESD